MTGLDCFLDGFQLIRLPGLRKYFIVPCIINAVVMMLLLVVVYSRFEFLVNIIASPFNSILSTKVEQLLTGSAQESTVSPWLIVPRSVGRELSKIVYVLPRLLGLILITIIPVINMVAPFLWVLFGAWMISIQYVDYAADNNGVSFEKLKSRMSEKMFDALMFGLPAYLLLMVPVVNLILMPIGVAGGTRFWVEHLR